MRRHRQGAGFSERSWIKHGLFHKGVHGQLAAFRELYPDGRILLIDGNAGDGSGVIKDADLFSGEAVSVPSAQLLVDFADRDGNADVCLCERDQARREALFHRFGRRHLIVADHADVLRYIDRNPGKYIYVLWLSDPCGYAGHGTDAMRAVAQRIRFSDFIISLNEGALNRVIRTKPDSMNWKPHREMYSDMVEPRWWLDLLGKHYLTRTPVFKPSSNFKFRVMVVSDHLTDASRQQPFNECVTATEEHKC